MEYIWRLGKSGGLSTTVVKYQEIRNEGGTNKRAKKEKPIKQKENKEHGFPEGKYFKTGKDYTWVALSFKRPVS